LLFVTLRRGGKSKWSYKGKGDKERSFKDKHAQKSTYEEGSFKRKARTNTSNDGPAFNDPFMNDAPKKKAKKPHKKKLARAAALKAKGKGGVKKGARKSTRKKDRS